MNNNTNKATIKHAMFARNIVHLLSTNNFTTLKYAHQNIDEHITDTFEQNKTLYALKLSQLGYNILNVNSLPVSGDILAESGEHVETEQ